MTSGNGGMSEAAKKARREYTNAYRRKNKDKVRQWTANYWERKAAREAEENEKERLSGH